MKPKARSKPRPAPAAAPPERPVPAPLPPSDIISSLKGAGALGIDPLGFADERLAELEAVAAILGQRGPAPTSAAAIPGARRRRTADPRQLHRLLRRRTGSSSVPRWRTRQPVPAALRHERLGVSRRDKRRAAVLRARALGRGGLCTEAWHAKRFEMAQAFGSRLPWRACDRAPTSAVRAAKESCVLHDASYHRTLRLVGAPSALAALLERTSDAAPGSLSARLGRGREVSLELHELDSYPAGAIGPARLIRATAASHAAGPAAAADAAAVPATAEADAPASLLLFVHQAALGHALSTLRAAAESCAGSTSPPSSELDPQTNPEAAPVAAPETRSGSRATPITVKLGPPLMRFQLRGPTSHRVLTRALAPTDAPQPNLAPRAAAASSSAAASSAAPAASTAGAASAALSASSAWTALSQLSCPASLPPRAVLGLSLVLRSPAERAATGKTGGKTGGAGGGAAALRRLATCWPAYLSSSLLLSSEVASEMASEMASAGGAACGAAFDAVLIQEPPLSPVRGAGCAGGGSGSGWDLLLPTAVGAAVWVALVLAGGRAIGQLELRAICMHAGVPCFPYDSPHTPAGGECALVEERSAAGTFSDRIGEV